MDIKYIKEYRKLGLNIAYYRKERGYTQMVLSELLDIDRTHMSAIERAESGASIDVLFRLSDVLDVPVHKFLEFRD
ncbi:MAG: helix-turn-helix transcriptional regulator [Oscillospiraceae bacterium]|jgi:transcriptional regulator with XRE-family HTH domain|nr:helix-turn-helix transcriptional regulator [Oscillospiraceae bacterium]